MWEWLRQAIIAGATFFVIGSAPLWIGLWWTRRRQLVDRQVRAMEQQIWDERRTPEEIARDQAAHAVAAGVRREARRRLGLPEDYGAS